MIARFKDAFAHALPQLPRKELSWRLHFIMGALSYTLAGTDALKIIAELNPVETATTRSCCGASRRSCSRASTRRFPSSPTCRASLTTRSLTPSRTLRC
jgi:hypothetical protein